MYTAIDMPLPTRSSTLIRFFTVSLFDQDFNFKFIMLSTVSENDIVGVRDVNTMLRIVLIVFLGSHFIWFLRMYMLSDTWIQNEELELQDAERQKEAVRQLLNSDA